MYSSRGRLVRITCSDLSRAPIHVVSGTGKSLLLRAIISALRKKYSKKPECVSITASTGMAASNIGGTTYLRLAGLTRHSNDLS